jgi:hypothetical protein
VTVLVGAYVGYAVHGEPLLSEKFRGAANLVHVESSNAPVHAATVSSVSSGPSSASSSNRSESNEGVE